MQSINNSTELNNSTLASSELQDNRSNAPVVKLCPHSTGVSCGSCRLTELCLPIALSEGEMQQLDDIVERNRPYKKAAISIANTMNLSQFLQYAQVVLILML